MAPRSCSRSLYSVTLGQRYAATRDELYGYSCNARRVDTGKNMRWTVGEQENASHSSQHTPHTAVCTRKYALGCRLPAKCIAHFAAHTPHRRVHRKYVLECQRPPTIYHTSRTTHPLPLCAPQICDGLATTTNNLPHISHHTPRTAAGNRENALDCQRPQKSTAHLRPHPPDRCVYRKYVLDWQRPPTIYHTSRTTHLAPLLATAKTHWTGKDRRNLPHISHHTPRTAAGNRENALDCQRPQKATAHLRPHPPDRCVYRTYIAERSIYIYILIHTTTRTN
jgi:hypothetical protein